MKILSMKKPNVVFAFDTIVMAFEYANCDDRSNEAYLDRHSGKSLYFSTLGDSDDEPDHFDDDSHYVAIPDTRDFGLGTQLAVQFASEVAPSLLENVREAFSGRGGFRRFKELLDRNNLLEPWYEFETEHERAAICNGAQTTTFATRWTIQLADNHRMQRRRLPFNSEITQSMPATDA